MKSRRVSPWVYSAVGVALLLVVIELVGRFGLAGRSWPPLSSVIAYLGQPVQQSLLLRALASTALSALVGLVVGTVVATAAAVAALLLPALRPGMDRLAAIVNAVPLIALAPLLITTAGRENTPTAVAALGTGFVVFVAMTSGLFVSKPSHSDVFSVYGSNRWRRLIFLQLPASIPHFFDGLALAAPTAVLGATIGEWFGAPLGLGVLIVSAMQNYQIPLLWAAAIASTLLSLLAYVGATRMRSAAAGRFA